MEYYINHVLLLLLLLLLFTLKSSAWCIGPKRRVFLWSPEAGFWQEVSLGMLALFVLASRYIMATSKELVNFYVQLMSLTSFSLLFQSHYINAVVYSLPAYGDKYSKIQLLQKKLINFLFLGTELEMDNLADDPPPFPTLDEMICGEFLCQHQHDYCKT